MVYTGAIELKLRSLRSEFSAKLREQKKPSGSGGGKPKKTWRFFHLLLFLKDYVVPRGNVSNLPSSLSSASLTEPKEPSEVIALWFKGT